MQLHKDLLELTSMVQREVRIDANIFRDARVEVSLNAQVCFVLLAGQLTTELHDHG